MFNMLFQVWFLIAILPLTIAEEGWKMLKNPRSQG